jgi:flavin reductase (DIM6/NTAB) family NADH-FMN oxidoreductase RutF
MREAKLELLTGEVFTRIDKQWMLITAGPAADCNTMTASWGGLGILWRRPVSTIYVRPQRYTRSFLEREDYYTLAFLPEEYRKALQYCGSHSGREGDKFDACGLHKAQADCGVAYPAEAELVLVCRKLYWQDMDPTHFLLPEIETVNYPEKDYHRIYIGEITQVLTKE